MIIYFPVDEPTSLSLSLSLGGWFLVVICDTFALGRGEKTGFFMVAIMEWRICEVGYSILTIISLICRINRWRQRYIWQLSSVMSELSNYF